MKSNIRIAKQLVRIARILVAFNRNELEKQLKQKRSDLNEESLKEHLDCLEKMDAKEQKVALHWIGKKTLTLPEDLSKFNNAMNLIKKQHLDFQKFDDPMEVLNRDDKSTLKIRSQDEVFNPSTEKTFSHPYNAGDGVIIYNVEDSKEGQLAVRRAIDFHFGYDKNFWCLASREEGFDQDEINELSEEQAEKLGFYSDDALAVAWNYWKENSAYPKRIAFKNGKLFAFSAGKKKQHVEWWDRNDKSHYNIPESNAVDDIEFLKKYGKINLLESDSTSPEILKELAEDEDVEVRRLAVKHPSIPVEALTKLAEDRSLVVRSEVAYNPNTPVELLKNLSEDKEETVRYVVSRNPRTPVEALRKLAGDKDAGVRHGIADNPRTPVEALRKLVEDEDLHVRREVAKHPNTTVDILTKLAEDEDWHVRKEVARNSRTPVDILKKLAEDRDWHVRYKLADNPNTPDDILWKLAEDKNEGVRYQLADNPNTPEDILWKLADDKDRWVRESAKRQLSNRRQ